MWKRIIVIAAVAGLVVGGTASSAFGGQGHDPVTFCHNGHTITTDDTGLIEGHMRHVNTGKDSLGECTSAPTPSSPSPTPAPSSSSTPVGTGEPSTGPSSGSTPPSPIKCEEGYAPGWLDENGNPQGCVANGIPNWEEAEEPTVEIGEPMVADPPAVEKAPSPTPVVATPKFTG